MATKPTKSDLADSVQIALSLNSLGVQTLSSFIIVPMCTTNPNLQKANCGNRLFLSIDFHFYQLLPSVQKFH